MEKGKLCKEILEIISKDREEKEMDQRVMQLVQAGIKQFIIMDFDDSQFVKKE